MERGLTEKSKFKGRVFSNASTFRIVEARKFTIGVLASSFIIAGLVNSEARALGVGAAQSDSYIGEHLDVRIPLFNVVDPNSLSISLQSEQFDGAGQAKVNAVLDRSNSQLSIKLSSDSEINEPYVRFKLDLIDSDTDFSKEFIVLMDLRADGAAAQIERFKSNFAELNTRRASGNGSLMGPYDTALAGQIPERFGAVLDGQSLWRVARRINEAMGVSRSQMMWSLYQANPDAFSSRSVSSLKAGSFLAIPDESVVKAYSDSQAKAQLAGLRLGRPLSSKPDIVARDNDVVQEFGLTQEVGNSSDEANEIESTETAALTESQFQVTGIDNAGQSLGGLDDAQSQQIISSLTETVGNLSQQLIRKDQKIEFLEQQVIELKSFIGEDGVAQLSEQSDFEEPADPALTIRDTGVSNANQTPLDGTEGEVASSSSSIAQAAPIWQWVLLCFFALSVLAYFMRDRFLALLQALNLFGSNDQVEFNSVALQDVDATDAEVVQKGYQEPPKKAPQEPRLEVDARVDDKDYSIMNAVEKSMADKDVLDSISYLDLADDGSYEENDILEFETEEMTEEIEDLSFDERFERLLAEKDFDFARELLDFARYNEINDERYHCERLRLFEKMRDEDGFYEYYYEIESKIPTFPQNLQTQISQLVVQLAHH